MKVWQVVGMGHKCLYSIQEFTRVGALFAFLRLFGVHDLGAWIAESYETPERGLHLIDPTTGSVITKVREVVYA